MGGITLTDNPPDDPEGSFIHSSSLYNPSLIKDLNLLNFNGSLSTASATATAASTFSTFDVSTANAQTASSTFSISDYLVPALQTKVWDDWQAADDFSAFDPQTFPSDINALPFQLDFDGNSPIWDNSDIPSDQAYDELVFDLSPSAFDVPTTVNVADLIVGPNSMASPAAVSPLDLAMSNDGTYQDLALANFYGFNDASEAFDSESDSDSDGDSEEEDVDGEIEDVEEKVVLNDSQKEASEVVDEPNVTAPLSMTTESIVTGVCVEEARVENNVVISTIKPEDPNKRRMEEALAARISNDLGPEHMTGLFKILKGMPADQEDGDEDEEMEVDLSSLDEATLVEVYQYVESCCMQTMGSIIAAEQRERVALAAAEASEIERLMMERAYAERTPELSPSHSCSSSNPSSPPHPSSQLPSPSKGSRSSNGIHKKHHGTVIVNHEMGDHHLGQDALWASSVSHPYKSTGRRKRSNTGSRSKIQKDIQYQQNYATGEAVVLPAANECNEMEYGEDAEIDIMGI
ncbi:hypothetical protein BGZ49_010798 [Haplosporangium sp. Z 27]|nr:hypothetical protein BGZ49_010798 [Haplosporangium sp. Z 27]